MKIDNLRDIELTLDQIKGYTVDRIDFSFFNRSIQLVLRQDGKTLPDRALVFNDCFLFQDQGLTLSSIDKAIVVNPPGIIFHKVLTENNVEPFKLFELYISSLEPNTLMNPVYSYRGIRLVCSSLEIINDWRNFYIQ